MIEIWEEIYEIYTFSCNFHDYYKPHLGSKHQLLMLIPQVNVQQTIF
jgi:hypothetical protein